MNPLGMSAWLKIAKSAASDLTAIRKLLEQLVALQKERP